MITYDKMLADSANRLVVTSLEQSKSLKKQGVRPTFITHSWVLFDNPIPKGLDDDTQTKGWVLHSGKLPNLPTLEIVPAFTVQDLLDLVGEDVVIVKHQKAYVCGGLSRVSLPGQFRLRDSYKGPTVIDALYYLLVAKLVKDKK